VKCAIHTDTETGLSCGRCGTPICPKCLVETPVGARCRKCANVRKLPTYNVTPFQYAEAIAAGLVIAVLVGIAWAFLRMEVEIFVWSLLGSLLLAAGAAYVIAEVVSRVVNRKRGTPLQVVAAACFVLSYVVSNVWIAGGAMSFFGYFDPIDILVLIAGIVVAVTRLR
jgi:hypothetical protein